MNNRISDKDKNKTLNWLNTKRQEAEERAQGERQKTHLAPIKHVQKDFFIADLFDAITYRIDLKSMEYPLFALKAGDKKNVHWVYNGLHVRITPTTAGRATIHDKDLWIYAISKLMGAANQGEEISRTVRFTVYDYLITTNRGVSGEYYKKAKESLERLAGTRINIEHEDKSLRIATGFGLLESWKIIEQKDGRMVRVEMTLPDWLYQSIVDSKVKQISADYFRLRKPLDRRIYELACKHCGNQERWKIGIELLHKKTGSLDALRNFKVAIKSLVSSNDLPDYSIKFDEINQQVIFKSRNLNKRYKEFCGRYI